MKFLIKMRLFQHLKKMERDVDVGLVLATAFGSVRPDDKTILSLARAIQHTQPRADEHNPESMITVEIPKGEYT